MKFGFLTSGGDCAGLNAVMRAIALYLDRNVKNAEFLGIPDGVIPMAVLAIGHPDPAAGEKPKDKWKPQKVHFGKW